jgi:predicted metal-binding membrane protein
MMSPAMMALMTTAMMVAMMLPSIAPVLWRYHRQLRAMRAESAGRRTALLAAGYASIWALVSVALFAMSAELSPMGMPSMGPSFAPLMVGVVVLCAGAIQCSPWKARQLVRCGDACVDVHSSGITAWWNGCRLGVDCCLSCAAPMAVLFVAGLMDARMMLTISTVVTAERVVPHGPRIARLTGAIALIAGIVICVRAMAGTTPGLVVLGLSRESHAQTNAVRAPQ